MNWLSSLPIASITPTRPHLAHIKVLDVLEVGGQFSEQRVEAEIVAESAEREAPEREGEEDLLLRQGNHLEGGSIKMIRRIEKGCGMVTK